MENSQQLSQRKPFKVGDTLIILNKKLREEAPEGRDTITIKSFNSNGWVAIQYQDGTNDYLTYSLLEDHWGPSKAYGSPLWEAMNGA
jgi:hypothetical protein